MMINQFIWGWGWGGCLRSSCCGANPTLMGRDPVEPEGRPLLRDQIMKTEIPEPDKVSLRDPRVQKVQQPVGLQWSQGSPHTIRDLVHILPGSDLVSN